MPATRTCREYTDKYGDSKVNCATCVKWDRIDKKCADEKGVVSRYEETPGYTDYKRLMEDAVSIRID